MNTYSLTALNPVGQTTITSNGTTLTGGCLKRGEGIGNVIGHVATGSQVVINTTGGYTHILIDCTDSDLRKGEDG